MIVVFLKSDHVFCNTRSRDGIEPIGVRHYGRIEEHVGAAVLAQSGDARLGIGDVAEGDGVGGSKITVSSIKNL